MGEYSRLGCGIWHWPPFVELEAEPRILWLGLYTSSEAKRLLPGLWHGGIGTMADAVRMPQDTVLKSLDVLIDRRLAEYDQRSRVLRLTALPDTGERAHNGKAVKGWWNRFVTIPACPVRDAHVPLLWWLLEGGGRSDDMLGAWNETFARVVIPPPSARFQRLVDSDTSTVRQPSLFATAGVTTPRPESPSDEKSDTSGTVSEWVSIPTGSGSGIGTGIGSGSSSSPDPEQGGESARGEPPRHLALVPPPADVPFTVVELLGALGQAVNGLPLDDAARSRLACQLPGCGATMEDLALLCEYIRARGISRHDLVTLLGSDHLGNAFARARAWRQSEIDRVKKAEEDLAFMRAAAEKTGFSL